MNSLLKSQLLVFLGSFLVSGVILWIVPYDEAVLLEFSFFWKWLVAVALVAGVAASRTKLTFPECVSASAFGPSTAGLVRIIVESVADPSKHNLWPFELVISLCIGGIAALAGAGLIFAVRGSRKREKPEA